MNTSKTRKNYSLYFKKTVLKRLEENNHNIAQTAAEFNIHRKNIQRWTKQKDVLNRAALNRDINTRTAKRIRQGVSPYPLLDVALVDFIKQKREERLVVTGNMIRRKAIAAFHELYPDSDIAFKASKGWLARFLKRNNITFRRATSVGQKIPQNAPELCDEFLDDMKSLKDYDIIMNMDETPCYFDIPLSSSFDFKGVKTVKMKTTGNEKLRFTVALTAGVKRVGNEFNAVRLPPMLIFKNLKKAPKGKFPPGMAVLGSKGGTMKQTFMVNTFIPKIWKRRPGGFFNTGQSLLLMDSATCHLNGGIPEALTECNTDYKYIDTGMTPLLQFLDSHINKPFKDGLKEKWQDWIDSGECEYTDAGNRRRASYTMVAEWVFDVWRKVATEDLILRGFRQCGYIGWNGDVSTLHSKLRATVESREVPNEVIEEMNAFLEEMRMAEAEEIVDEDEDTAEEQGDELDTGEEPDGIETDEEDFEDEEDIDILF